MFIFHSQKKKMSSLDASVSNQQAEFGVPQQLEIGEQVEIIMSYNHYNIATGVYIPSINLFCV